MQKPNQYFYVDRGRSYIHEVEDSMIGELLAAVDVAPEIKDAGLADNLVLVGGKNRDFFMGNTSNDDDFVITNTTEEELLEIGLTKVQGTRFPVFLDSLGNEIALPRKEKSTGQSRDDFAMDAVGPDVSLEQDLKRRDLTINSIAVRMNNGTIVTPPNQSPLDDLDNKVLRHVSGAFTEDPLRVVRLARFAARFPDFTIASETQELAKTVVPALADEAQERVTEELLKTLRQAENPRIFFDVLKELNALEEFFPHVANLINVPAGPNKYHGEEEDSFEHTMRIVEEISSIRPNDERAGLIAVFHDIGKTLTDSDEFPHHYNHTGDEATELVEEISQNLQLSNEHQGLIKSAVRFHMHAHKINELNHGTLIELSEHLHVENTGELDSVPHMTHGEFIALGRSDKRGRSSDEVSTISQIEINRLIQAEQVINDIGGEEVLNRFEPNNGEHIGELIHQERVRELRNRL